MTRVHAAVTFPLILIIAATPALAQEAASKTVTLDLNAVAPAAAFKAVADAIGVTASVDPALTEPVDISVRNVSARTALTAMCESIGCQWTLAGGTLAVKPRSQPAFKIGVVQSAGLEAGAEKRKAAAARAQVVLDALKRKLPANLKFDDAPLGVVSGHLSDALDMKVELTCRDSSVKTLTMDFGGLTLQSALQALARQDSAKGPWRLIVGPKPGDTETPSIAIMVGPGTARKK